MYELSIPIGVLDATTFLKTKFWEPPYEYKMVSLDDEVILVGRQA